jgi:hypothetical protein
MKPNKVYLALRSGAPDGANWLQREFSRLTQKRLVSDYCHGGVVVADQNGLGLLLQSNLSHGVHCVQPDGWQPEKWTLIETDRDPARVLELFSYVEGEAYDVGELAAYIGIYLGAKQKYLCFELADLLLETNIAGRKTPERLIVPFTQKWS